MKNKNVLVTGGGGMVAQQLVRLLKEEGSNVTTVDLPTSGVPADLQGDLRDRSFCKEIVKGQEIVFNLAGLKGSPQRVFGSTRFF